MALLQFPTKIPSKQKFYLEYNSQTQESIFTRKKTVFVLSGARWMCRFSFSVLNKDEYDKVLNFVYQCRGQLNTVEVGDFLRSDVAYAHTGVSVRNASALFVGTYNAGDIPSYIRVKGRLKKIISATKETDYVLPHGYFADHYVIETGAEFVIEPPVEGQVTGDIADSEIDISGKGIFRLTDDRQAANFSFNGYTGEGFLMLEEAL